MKTRPLPDLDLARIAPLPADQKRNALEQLKIGRPPYSYAPTRQVLLETLNIDAGPLGMVPRAAWPLIAGQITRASRSEKEEAANLAVAESLYAFAEDYKIGGRRFDFFPLSIGVSGKVSFWLPAVAAVDARPMALFVDPRVSKKLTAEGRRFAFSAMHERIRVADPDFADVGLGIIQFDAMSDGTRLAKLHTLAEGEHLFDFSELDEMVRGTYEVWHEVLAERDEQARRSGTGYRGPLV